MSDRTVVNNASMGLFGWLTVLFVGLKLTGHIDWSWWWVLSPALASFALFFGLFLFLLILGVFGRIGK